MQLEQEITYFFKDITERDLRDLKWAIETYIQWADGKSAHCDMSERLDDLLCDIDDTLADI